MSGDGPHRIVADENIRRATAAFSGFGEVTLMPGREISSADLSSVDILLVRSVTPVNAQLLSNSEVRFVGSATTGTDHVDRGYLDGAGVRFAHAPGANADSVVEYVTAALLELAVRRDVSLHEQTVGIIGCGQIGGRLAKRLPGLGVEVLKNDPPLAERAREEGRPHDYVSLDVILAEADIVTLHTPLTVNGPHPTHHLFGADRLSRLSPSTWLFNTCRGAVVDNDALFEALESGGLSAAVLDVWEREPNPPPELIDRCALATPHIAGYSYDGKLAGTIMLYDALEEYLGVSGGWDYRAELALEDAAHGQLRPPDGSLNEREWLHRLVRQMYDIAADDARMRKIIDMSSEDRDAYFVDLRRTYARRRSFSNFMVDARAVPPPLRRAVSAGLNVRLQ